MLLYLPNHQKEDNYTKLKKESFGCFTQKRGGE